VSAARTAVITAGALAGAASFLYGQVRARTAAPLPPAPGELVEVGGETLHVLHNPAGTGPAVVFESALACPGTEWAWLLRELDGRVPYLAYDRPGNGWSSQRAPVTGAAELNELTRQLLRRTGVPGPYVLVGHSVGGLLIRTYAAAHPDEVAGLVLVDSTHPDQLDRSQIQREGMPLVAHGIARALWRARFGVRPAGRPYGAVHELPAELEAATVEVLAHPGPWLAARREFGLWQTAWAEATRSAHLPADLPVAVVTAGDQAAGDPVHAQLQRELAGLTSVGRHDVVPDTDHETVVMVRSHATRVLDAVEWVAQTSRERV